VLAAATASTAGGVTCAGGVSFTGSDGIPLVAATTTIVFDFLALVTVASAGSAGSETATGRTISCVSNRGIATSAAGTPISGCTATEAATPG
jgi:hypothetical protein